MVIIRCVKGALSAPLFVILGVIALGGLGVWGFLRHGRHLLEIQLRLDRCVGEKTQDLRSTLNQLASENRQIQTLRTSIQAANAASWVLPGATAPLAALKAALSATVIRQDLTLTHWKLKQGQWLAFQGCGQRGDRVTPLPSLPLHRAPADPIGPHPFTWTGPLPTSLRLQISHPPRHSATEVSQEKKGESFDQSEWKAEWALPTKSLWPSFP